MTTFRVRRATVNDVASIQALVRPLALEGILLDKEDVAYYEAIQEFLVAETEDGMMLGCGALHVMWQNLAEIRTLAAVPTARGRGVGAALVRALLERARDLGVDSVFCLTFGGGFL